MTSIPLFIDKEQRSIRAGWHPKQVLSLNLTTTRSQNCLKSVCEEELPLKFERDSVWFLSRNQTNQLSFQARTDRSASRKTIIGSGRQAIWILTHRTTADTIVKLTDVANKAVEGTKWMNSSKEYCAVWPSTQKMLSIWPIGLIF